MEDYPVDKENDVARYCVAYQVNTPVGPLILVDIMGPVNSHALLVDRLARPNFYAQYDAHVLIPSVAGNTPLGVGASVLFGNNVLVSGLPPHLQTSIANMRLDFDLRKDVISRRKATYNINTLELKYT